MIDPNEDLLSARQACRERVFRNPDNNKPLHISGMYRHMTRGVLGPDGERVVLESIQTVRGRMTSRQAIHRFLQKLNDVQPTVHAASGSLREKRIDAAEAELAANGM